MPRKIFTSFQVAKLCGVSPSTVIHWVNIGSLPAFRTPGGHRRVQAQDLLEFVKKYKMPVPEELTGAGMPRKKVLIVDDEPAVAGMIKRAFSRKEELFEARAITDGIEALMVIGKWLPDLVVLDAVMPVVDGLRVCATLKNDPQTRHIKIIAITGKRLGDSDREFLQKNADAFYTKPLNIVELLQRAEELLALSEVTL